jgi:hypothetical protein
MMGGFSAPSLQRVASEMSLKELLPPPGFVSLALWWGMVAMGWTAATAWIDRDARQRFGDSRPWKEAFVALGCLLAYCAFFTGLWFVEGIAWLIALLAAAYVAMQTATVGEWGPGPICEEVRVVCLCVRACVIVCVWCVRCVCVCVCVCE